MEHIIFEENFNDNSNNWWVGKDESGWCDIVDNSYVIEHTKETGDYATWRSFSIVESKAYSIEASFTFLGGYTKNGFGLLWGQKSKEESDGRYSGFHYFVISASGKFVIRSYNPDSEKAEAVNDWTDCSYIKTGENEANVLKIVKFDEEIDIRLYFLINEQMIYQSNYLPLFGDETGFIAFQNMKIAIDNFKINFWFKQTLI